MENLRDFIQVVPNVLTKKDCRQIVSQLKNSNLWVPTRIRNGEIDSEVRSCYAIRITEESKNPNNIDSNIHQIDAMLFSAAGKALTSYQDKIPSVSVSLDTGYDLLRYEKGQFYTSHVDHSTERHRLLSCSFALNDNYEGGEWAFFNRGLELKVPAGSAVLFPSNFCFPHEILPVTKGTRYSVVTWFI